MFEFTEFKYEGFIIDTLTDGRLHIMSDIYDVEYIVDDVMEALNSIKEIIDMI
jgi:hypothetical protein